VFEQEWMLKFGNTPPIGRSENLAYTPMVLVMWKERYDAFIKRYGVLSLETISQAMQEPGGWDAIAGKPEWGPFKFTHTDPETSNSGMLALVLTAYAHADKVSGLTVEDVTRADYQNWLASFERSLTRPGGAGPLSRSTGTQMKEMVLRGPSQIDCLLVYENLAIDYLRDAEQRWGELRVVYPDPGMWNENPFYILDVPWSDERQRAAAGAFLDFLMSEPLQRRALELGFRPGNTSVGVRVPGSPLISNERYGVSVEVPRMCEPPRADVLSSLLTTFRRLPR
jgi:Ca-activated chloride channel family protein